MKQLDMFDLMYNDFKLEKRLKDYLERGIVWKDT